jgi:hypothetical protein
MPAGPPQPARSVGGPASRPISAAQIQRWAVIFRSPTCRPLASGESGFSAPYPGRVAGGGVVRSPPPRYRLCPKVVRGTRLPPSPLPPPLTSSYVILTSAPPPAPAPVALHVALPPYPPATVSCHPGLHLSSHVTSVPGPAMTSC